MTKTKVLKPLISLDVSLKGISKTSNFSSSTPPTLEKKIYSASDFPWFFIFLNEFMMRHHGLDGFLGEQSMQNFHQLLDAKFFEWLNYRKNSDKKIYEIKREFMSIAEAVLFFELANHQRRLTPFGFVIGPFQKMLQMFEEESDSFNFGVIPYSIPLSTPPVSKLEDTKLYIHEDEMRLYGLDTFNADDGFDLQDVSHFFNDSE
jgi:hypothetical protein